MDVSLRLILKDKGGTMFSILLFLTWELRYFWKRGNIKKGCIKWKIEAPLYTLFWAFKKIPFTLYTFVLAKILQNGVKFIQKLTPRFKNHMRNLDNFREAAGNQKSWNSMGYFCAKNTFFQLKHYILRIYLTLLSATCVKIHQILYWNHKSFFTTQLFCIFLAHIIILHNITSHNITYFLQKWFIKVQVSRLSTARIKTHQIPHVIFETKSQFFLKICITFQCRET